MVYTGARARSSDFKNLQVVTKSSDQSVTSSTTVIDDSDFGFSLEANHAYYIELHLSVSGSTTGDFKCQYSMTGGLTVSAFTRFGIGPATSNSGSGDTNVSARAMTALNAGNYGLDGSLYSGVLERIYIVPSVAGTLQLQWAQASSSGTATVVRGMTSGSVPGSFATLQEVEL